VIGITRGAIEQLDRNELQGVIAHEFSHIHHGDMLLNTRLTALLHGMLLLGLIGGMLLRGWSETSSGIRVSSRSSSNDKNGGGSVVLLVIGAGVVLYVLGYVGTFFGQLIKASVSRQREFLADASAVQFTRDPSTIAGALKKLRQQPAGRPAQRPTRGGIQPPVLRRRRGQQLVRYPPAAERAHPPRRAGLGRPLPEIRTAPGRGVDEQGSLDRRRHRPALPAQRRGSGGGRRGRAHRRPPAGSAQHPATPG